MIVKTIMVVIATLTLSTVSWAQDKSAAVPPTPLQQLLVQDFTALDNAMNAAEVAKLRIAEDFNALMGQQGHDQETLKWYERYFQGLRQQESAR